MSESTDDNSGNKQAADGHILVCCACGRTSTTRYGFNGDPPGPYVWPFPPGWDESCMLNAQEFPVNRIVWNADKSRVVEVLP